MLAKRVILSLCFVEGVLHRTKKFIPDYRYTQNFSWAPDADELVLIDVTPQPWPGWPDFLANYSYRRGVDIPVTANARVPSVEYARTILNAGADKLLINFKRKEIYCEISEAFGAQALVAGIDVASDKADHGDAGRGIRPGAIEDMARSAQALGAGEILLTSVDRDGSLGGYDLENICFSARSVKVPVLVAGGCGTWQHIKAAFEAGAQGACTSVIHHLAPSAMKACKQWLAQNYNGPIRPAEAA